MLSHTVPTPSPSVSNWSGLYDTGQLSQRSPTPSSSSSSCPAFDTSGQLSTGSSMPSPSSSGSQAFPSVTVRVGLDPGCTLSGSCPGNCVFHPHHCRYPALRIHKTRRCLVRHDSDNRRWHLGVSIAIGIRVRHAASAYAGPSCSDRSASSRQFPTLSPSLSGPSTGTPHTVHWQAGEIVQLVGSCYERCWRHRCFHW